ncbi:flagellar biosynthetic protein FliO [Chitinasiproducens palmae]|uniref:Flagellar protein n=1 Tax=Chitinasiproducens palmae TaxID=1770053 RepID=A0A1H2PJM1_9BURK|nr:flagellar biosynthetic protein FliO [Chitinasiproducens palmae]SDV46591.1 flagellar biosynthetic protein FliO [Chitinasiproducens palmae]
MRPCRRVARAGRPAHRAASGGSWTGRLAATVLAGVSAAALAVPTAGDWSARPDTRLASVPVVSTGGAGSQAALPSDPTTATGGSSATVNTPGTTNAPNTTNTTIAPNNAANAAVGTGTLPGTPPTAGNASAVVSPVSTPEMPRAASLPATPTPSAAGPAAPAAFGAAVSPASSPAPAAVPGATVPGFGVGSVLRTLLGLAAVLLAVLACGWLARRLNARGVSSGRLARVVGGVSLGNRERVAVVEIADTWLVLGVTPGGITTLHTLPAAARAASDVPRASVTSGADAGMTATSGDASLRGSPSNDAAGAATAAAAADRPPSFGEALRAQVRDRLQRRRDDA